LMTLWYAWIFCWYFCKLVVRCTRCKSAMDPGEVYSEPLGFLEQNVSLNRALENHATFKRAQ
jgi:hypothetical protein